VLWRHHSGRTACEDWSRTVSRAGEGYCRACDGCRTREHDEVKAPWSGGGDDGEGASQRVWLGTVAGDGEAVVG